MKSNNLKRIVSTIIAFLLIFTSAPISFAQENINDYQTEISDLRAMGIIEEEFPLDELTTRAEFARLIVKFMGLSDEKVFEGVQLFYDVPVTHPAFFAVSFCARNGYLTGSSDGYFKPDNSILAEEAVKCFILALGYKYQVKSAKDDYTGYISVANQIGLTKGLTMPYGENLLNQEVAKLIRNALNIPLAELKTISDERSFFEINEDKTALSEYHNMKEAKGIITATDVTGIFGFDAAEENHLIIGGERYNFYNPLFRTYLGYNVDFIYRIDDVTEKKEIVLCKINSKTKKLTILKEDFHSFSGGIFKYTDEKDNTKSVSVLRNFEFVYNGKSTRYDANLIRNAKYGRFEILSSGNTNSFDIVIFSDFKTLIADRISQSSKIVHDIGDSGDYITFDVTEYKTVIMDEEGNPIDFSKIKRHNVLTYFVNGDYIFTYVTNTTVFGMVYEKNEADKTVSIDGVYYDISKDKTDLFSLIPVNESGIAYLDCFGNITYFSASKSDKNINLYIPIQVSNPVNPDFEPVLLKVYDISDNKIKVLEFNQKVLLNGEMIKNPTGNMLDSALVKGKVPGTPAILNLNDEGKIIFVETPKKAEEYEEAKDGFTTLIESTKTYYSTITKSFQSFAYTDGTTKFLILPDNIKSAQESDFMITTAPKTSASRMVSAYSYSKKNPYASLITFLSSDYLIMDQRADTAVVTKVTTAVNEEGAICKKITYQVDNKDEEFCYLLDDTLEDLFKPNQGTPYYAPPVLAKDLVPGDIISVHKLANNNLISFNCLWKSDLRIFKSMRQQFLTDSRVVMGTVQEIGDEFMILKTDVKTASALTSLVSNEYLRIGDPVVKTIQNNGAFNVVSNNTMSDVCVGDTIILHAINYGTRRIFIIK